MPAIATMSPVVTTRAGRVRGSVDGGVRVFRGIPYAAAPFGPDRLLPPRPVAPWSDVRDALVLGAEPPQPRLPAGADDGLVYDPATPGEDCLNLNLWTPDADATGLPVMVWIPGGMFEVCSNASYDGSSFARDGVVCIAINYRVGSEGFSLPEGGHANLGLLDQVAALEWVRDNVAAFGGDPANVTIFGESAGAMSIGVLLAMPRADGLFRRAILQSGAAHHVMPVDTARTIARELAARLGVAPTREAMATLSWEHIVAAQTALKGDVMAHPDPARWSPEVVASMLPWHPILDGDVVPARPIERIAAGAAGRVDVLVGTNVDDWRIFTALNGQLGISEQVLAGPVVEHGPRCMAAFGLDAATALPAYRAAYPDATPGDVLAAVQTDWYVRIPAIRLADAHAAGPAGTWMYELAWRPQGPAAAFGACHALDIGFVFDTLDRGDAQMLGAALAGAPQSLADEMHRAWVAFATHGDPGWPRYDLARRATMRFDVASRVVDDPRAMERALWEGVR